MARSDDTVLYILIAALGVGALYLTRQFCPGGALPTDAFDGKLCPDSAFADEVADILTNTVPDLNKGGQLGDVGGAWQLAEKNLASCPRGFVKSGVNCVCNATAKKCGPNTVVRLMTGNRQDNVKGNCTCFKCSAGYTSVNNNCVKTGTVTSGCNKVCTGGYVKNNNPCSCVCNSIVHKCGANATARDNGKTCSCYCNTGYYASGGQCLKQTSGGATAPNAIQVNNAKLFLADVINRTVQACTGRNVGTTAVVQGYPSAISSMAKMNNYSQNKILAYNNRPFAKTFRSVVMAIVGSYKLNLSPICTQQMSCLNSRSMKECGLL